MPLVRSQFLKKTLQSIATYFIHGYSTNATTRVVFAPRRPSVCPLAPRRQNMQQPGRLQPRPAAVEVPAVQPRSTAVEVPVACHPPARGAGMPAVFRLGIDPRPGDATARGVCLRHATHSRHLTLRAPLTHRPSEVKGRLSVQL